MLVGGFCHNKLLCIMSFTFTDLLAIRLTSLCNLIFCIFTDLNMIIFDENCVLLMVGTS